MNWDLSLQQTCLQDPRPGISLPSCALISLYRTYFNHEDGTPPLPLPVPTSPAETAPSEATGTSRSDLPPLVVPVVGGRLG